MAVDSTGRVQGVLGFGAGQYERVSVNCNGDETGTSSVPFRGGGAQVDVWPNRKIRLTGFGGGIEADSSEWNGAYLGAVAALEFQHLGVGLGAMGSPDEAWPSLYLRAGNRDRVHLRFDAGAPSPPLNTGGAARLGVGYHLGHVRGLGGFGGLALCHARCDGNSNPAFFAEVRLPVGSRFDLELRGLAGSGKDFDNTGIAIAGRMHFAR